MWLLLAMIMIMPYEANPYLYLGANLLGVFPDFTVIKALGLLGFAWAQLASYFLMRRTPWYCSSAMTRV